MSTARLLPRLLERSAEASPDRIAVQDGERTLTYRELESWANRLARALIDSGVQRGDRVGLYLEKSAESLVGIYGAMKAGAAYVPLDPASPAARLAYIAQDCGIRVLLSSSRKVPGVGELHRRGAPVRVAVLLDADDPPHDAPAGVAVLTREEVAAEAADPPSVDTGEQDLAYILYTSGSTGEPKGVMLTHRNALTFVEWAADLVSIGPEDRLSSHAPLHFDLSIFDLFAAAVGGASVVVVPPERAMFPVEIARFIAQNEISVWYSVPSILSMLALRGGLSGGEFPHLRAVLFAGEVFAPKYLRRLMELLPHARFYNLYGPTETNVCTWYEVEEPPGDTQPVPIGKATAGTEVFAVTDDGRAARRGDPGELHVAGLGVMSGYWGDGERTAAVLVRDPTEARPGLVYRTGDLVVEEDDGNYRFLGRRDAQIKSRGYRIELGEIETAILAHPDVVECAVTAIPDELVTNRIRAHVVVRDHIGKKELVRFCSERLPKYMIPEEFEFADLLPKTSTGKIDRKALERGA